MTTIQLCEKVWKSAALAADYLIDLFMPAYVTVTLKNVGISFHIQDTNMVANAMLFTEYQKCQQFICEMRWKSKASGCN